jgi:leucine dehydrogenase
VLLADAPKTDALLTAFGRAVDMLGGRYVTAEDVGMTDADMATVALVTRHVAGLPVAEGAVGGNPGPFTARGVLAGIRAAVRHRLGRDHLDGLDVAVQGVGSVGAALARALAGAGARLVLADADAPRARRLARELGATCVDVADIARQPVHLFSPNALGGVLDAGCVAGLDCAIVAGAANNQLATAEDGARLAARDILYAPDYVINAGGIISVVAEYLGGATLASVNARVDAIGPRLAALFADAGRLGLLPHELADRTAMRLIGR